MFQLIYLTFTAPRADPEAFNVLTSQTKVAAREPAGDCRSFAFAEALHGGAHARTTSARGR